MLDKRGANTAILGTVLVGFPNRNCGVQILGDLCVFALVIDVFHVDNNFQQSLVANTPSEEEGAAATLPNARLEC